MLLLGWAGVWPWGGARDRRNDATLVLLEDDFTV